jgi:hypothetical protein
MLVLVGVLLRLLLSPISQYSSFQLEIVLSNGQNQLDVGPVDFYFLLHPFIVCIRKIL